MYDSFTNYFQVMVASMWILLEMVLIGAVLLYATVSLVLVEGGGGGGSSLDNSIFQRSCCLFGRTSYFKMEYLPKVYGFLEETPEGMV